MKPDPVLRNVLANEEVLIFSDKDIKKMSSEKLDMLINYYNTTLEVLVGTQIWHILDSLKAAKTEIFVRKNKSFKKAV